MASIATCLPIDIAVCSWHYRLEDKLEDGLADKSFRRLSASLYSVDAQRDVPMLEDMADIFTNSILYSSLLRIQTAIILRKDFAVWV